MCDHHSSLECENILPTFMIEKNLINNKEHVEQRDKIVVSKGKLVVYLSIIYGVMLAVGLIYLFVN
jgi:hypothetical protein